MAEVVMIAGHFGLAAAVKAKAPSVPLWGLMLACQWLDIVFVPLLATGIERFEPIAGAPVYGGAVIHANYTHSLVGALVLAAVFGVFFLPRYGRKAAFVIGLVALSHWFLDLPLHRGDMQIVPGAPGMLGFGLWRWPAIAAGLELALVIVGGVMYWRAANQVAAGDAALMRRARLCGVSVLVVGVLTLGLGLMGM